MEYIAYLHKDADSDYGVSFPDFPGCVTAGSSLEEARKMAAEALAFHIRGMRADHEAIPAPSTLDDLRDDPAREGCIAFLVTPEAEDRTVRVNITIPENQLAEIDRRAKAAHLSRSAYMVKHALLPQTPSSHSRNATGSMVIKPVPKDASRPGRRRFRQIA